MVSDEIRIEQRVVESLNEQGYDWRTVSGIARETSLDEGLINKTIFDLQRKGVVIESSKLDKNGREIFTTRDKYMGKRNFANHLFTALSDKIR